MLTRAVVEAIDPLMPVRRAPDPETQGDAAWLSQRGFLDGAAGASAEAAWRDVGGSLEAHYGPPWPDTRPPDEASTRHFLSHWLLEAAADIRPAAILATSTEDPDHVAFVGVIWPSPVYPRFIVHRPPDGPVLRDGLEAFLATLGTCAVKVTRWVRAPENVALDLFLAENRTRMAVLAKDPGGDGGVQWIPQGEETAAFQFAHPGLENLDRYAAGFQGPTPGPLALARVLPRVRTNMGPGEIRDLMNAVQ